MLLSATVAFGARPPAGVKKRPIEVADAIEMMRLSSYDDASSNTPAHYSPDGKRFFVLLKKANVQENRNEFDLRFYKTADALLSPEPEGQLAMSSNSNRDAIDEVKWLQGSQAVAFIGENPGENGQVYTFDIPSRRLEKRTSHVTAVTTFDITEDGQNIAFVAEPDRKNPLDTIETREFGFVVTPDSLWDLLRGARPIWNEYQLFVQQPGGVERQLRLDNNHAITRMSYWVTPHFSADGRLLLVYANRRNAPQLWRQYLDKRLQYGMNVDNGSGNTNAHVLEYLLINLASGSVKSLLNAPSIPWPEFHRFAWLPRENEILIHSFLPLNIDDATEAADRQRNAYDVAVNLSTGAFHKAPSTAWPKEMAADKVAQVRIAEDLNTPPVLQITDVMTGAKSTLLDLNPQFEDLEFGRVEAIEWKTPEGNQVEGGLYYPTDYAPGRLYPLVIQTHGFVRRQFSMDGRSEWNSGFAARPLAGKGFFVLQVGYYKDRASQTVLNTTREAPLEIAKYESAIDYLRERGLVDDQRVGIVGFSRTFYMVGCALVQSSHHFAAASLVDGIDAGYLQFLMFGPADSVMLNGAFPFGEGLKEWLERSPGFNLEKVQTPVRLVSTGAATWLAEWQWYALLKDLRKPVDFLYLPDAEHLMVKPSERRVAMQGLVDWFSFWLKGEEDADPSKTEQYARWRTLRRESKN
jgi:dipeptidyl aminopeptidase/acylaminoacyl peptidase